MESSQKKSHPKIERFKKIMRKIAPDESEVGSTVAHFSQQLPRPRNNTSMAYLPTCSMSAKFHSYYGTRCAQKPVRNGVMGPL